MNIYSADFSISFMSLPFIPFLRKVLHIFLMSHFNLNSVAFNFGDTFVTIQQNICGSPIWFRDTLLSYHSNMLLFLGFPNIVWGHPFVKIIKLTTTIDPSVPKP